MLGALRNSVEKMRDWVAVGTSLVTETISIDTTVEALSVDDEATASSCLGRGGVVERETRKHENKSEHVQHVRASTLVDDVGGLLCADHSAGGMSISAGEARDRAISVDSDSSGTRTAGAISDEGSPIDDSAIGNVGKTESAADFEAGGSLSFCKDACISSNATSAS
jgi:hypothetical protein